MSGKFKRIVALVSEAHARRVDLAEDLAITVWSASKLDQQASLHWHQSNHDNDFGVEK